MGPGGPPGLQNRCSPLCGKAGFDSQALPPAFAHLRRAIRLRLRLWPSHVSESRQAKAVCRSGEPRTRTRAAAQFSAARATASAGATGSATPAPATRRLFTRQRERHQLSTYPWTSDADDDVLTALMHVGHRQARLRTRHRCLPDLCAGRLVVGVEERQAASAFTGEQQRLGHQQPACDGLPVFGIVRPLSAGLFFTAGGVSPFGICQAISPLFML